MPDQDDAARPLTSKGEATRRRIVDATAELFYDHGIAATTNSDIRRAAGVSGSQLDHYFPTRAALVSAVLDQRVADAVDVERYPGSEMPNSFATLQQWRDSYVERYEHLTGGCKVGSLASETMKSPLELGDQIAAGYEAWRGALRDGLVTMQRSGELSDGADLDQLSHVLLAALQGGLLLTQAVGSTVPLAAALDGAIDLVRTHAPSRRRRVPRPRPDEETESV